MRPLAAFAVMLMLAPVAAWAQVNPKREACRQQARAAGLMGYRAKRAMESDSIAEQRHTFMRACMKRG